MPISNRRKRRDPRLKAFPDVPERYWRQFDRTWGELLTAMAHTISLAESFGTNANGEHFGDTEMVIGAALRTLHSRICRQARAVNMLAFSGLGEQAIAQWRTCHELAATALFIAEHPDTAPLYIKSEYYEKYLLAKAIPEGAPEAPSTDEIAELKRLAAEYEEEVRRTYHFKPTRKLTSESWSGHDNFAQIEAEVFSDFEWRPRPDYRLASHQTHASSNAGHPVPDNRGGMVFPTGPIDEGLTDAVDKTLLSVMQATAALLIAGTYTHDEFVEFEVLQEQREVVSTACWLTDPAILCKACDGFVPGAMLPEGLPDEYAPHPCHCP